MYFMILILNRFPAEVGPGTRPNGSGSADGAERTQNQPRKQTISWSRPKIEIQSVPQSDSKMNAMGLYWGVAAPTLSET